MLAVKTATGQGRYSATGSTEWDTIFSTSQSGPLLIWCHGNNATTLSDYTNYNDQLRLMAQRFTVVHADLAGSSFGNDDSMSRLDDLFTYMGATEAAFIGASMGGCVALNYLSRHPEKVIAFAGIIPGIDLNDAVVRATAAADEINAAYGGTYNDATDGPTHSPIQFADQLDTTVPKHIWASTDDPICTYSITEDFCAQSGTGLTSLGNQGHSGIVLATPLVNDWLEQYAV